MKSVAEVLPSALRILQNTTSVDEDEDQSTFDRVFGLLINVGAFLMIFGLSGAVKVSDLKTQLRNYRGWITGACLQFLFIPLLGYLSVVVFDLPPERGLSLLTITSSSGGTLSNWWCGLFNADLPLSVALTTMSSFISIFMLPCNLLFYTYLAYDGKDGKDAISSIDFGGVFLALGIVVGGVVLGTLASAKWNAQGFRTACYRLATSVGIVLSLMSFGVSLRGEEDDTQLWQQPANIYLATALPCILGMLLANLVACAVKLPPPQRVTVSIECFYQNLFIAISVAVNVFTDKNDRARATVIPLFYGVVAYAMAMVYLLTAWKAGWTNAPADERIWTVLTKLYESKHPKEAPKNEEKDLDCEMSDAIETDMDTTQRGAADAVVNESGGNIRNSSV